MKPDNLNDALATSTIYFAKFDKVISYDFDYEDALDDYDNQCILTFLSWDEPLFIKLQNASFDYYQSYDYETSDGMNELGINSPEDIWQHCYPTGIRFNRSEKYPTDVFTVVYLECEWEIEHGMSWAVRNASEPMFVGPQGNLHTFDEKQHLGLWNFA